MILSYILEPTSIQKFKTVAYHKTKAINKDKFSKDLAREFTSQGTNTISVKDKITYCNETLMKVLNKHAPLHTRGVTNCKTIPWYNDNISEAIHKRHRLERVWKKTKKSQCYINFYRQCHLVANMLDTAE